MLGEITESVKINYAPEGPQINYKNERNYFHVLHMVVTYGHALTPRKDISRCLT